MVEGTGVFSKKMRQPAELSIIEQKGTGTLIVELQGHLFFGTTDQLIEKLNLDLHRYAYVLFDMRKVQSIDFTAAKMLVQILERLKHGHGHLVLSSIPNRLPTGQNIREYLEQLGLNESNDLHIFPSLNDALEWVEDQMLVGTTSAGAETLPLTDLSSLELFQGFSNEVMNALLTITEQKQYKKGKLVFRSGDVNDEIYIVKSGTVRILLKMNDEKEHHILTVATGGIFGELAFLDNVTRSADARAESDLELYVLSKEKFMVVTLQYPDVAGRFYEHLALIMANRLRQSNKELKLFNEA